MISFDLPYWYDLHMHMRQEGLVAPILKSQLDMGCCGVLAMPNTKPPTAKVLKSDPLPYWSIEEYREMIVDAGGDEFLAFITPLYITKDTTAQMIEDGAKAGILQACKYYPPHGTTGADFGYPMEELLKGDVFKAISDNNVVLCIHGEEHHMSGEDYLSRSSSAEEFFYRERVPKLIDQNPDLRIVCEHITTKVAANLVSEASDNIAASITPQHLIYTIGDLLQGLKYHLYCLPLIKFAEDRDALREAATDPNNTKFFAGTDSAAHTTKATQCGCAAGCFTGGVAPQLYAEAFEMAGCDLSDTANQKIFEAFMCHIGREYYDLPKPNKMLRLTKTPQSITMLDTPDGPITPLPLGMEQETIPWSLKLLD